MFVTGNRMTFRRGYHVLGRGVAHAGCEFRVTYHAESHGGALRRRVPAMSVVQWVACRVALLGRRSVVACEPRRRMRDGFVVAVRSGVKTSVVRRWRLWRI